MIEEDVSLDLEEEDESIGQELPTKKMTDIEVDEYYTKESFRVIYQTNTFLLPQIVGLISSREVLNIRPEYQRRLRWDTKKKSQLIESLLLNIPVPPVFFYEGDMARYEVMDGQQRLNAIKEFFNNEFRLVGLTELYPLNGKTYSQCPPKVKRGLERSSIAAIVLLRESEEREHDPQLIRRHVFDRLNTGGQKLNPQEVRNCLYAGSFNEAVVDLARDRMFTDIWGIPAYADNDQADIYDNLERQKNSLYKTMGDCQIVLRFFALRDQENIKGSMRSILDGCMRAHMRADPDKISIFMEEYRSRLSLARDTFGEAAFRLPGKAGSRSKPSIPLYDAVMVALDHLWDSRSRILERAADIRAATDEALKNRESYEVLIGRGNTAQAVNDRINLAKNLIISCL